MPQHHPTEPVSDLEPVPVNILLPRPKGAGRLVTAPATEDPYGLTADTAARVITNYTRPGDRVAVLDDSVHVRHAVTGHDRHLAAPMSDTGDRRRVRLVIAAIPRPGHPAWSLGTLVTWMSACHDRLTPGGHLVACVSAGHGRYVDHASDVLAAAASVGLAYQAHLLAVHAPLPEREPRAEAGHPGRRPLLPGRRHPRAHSDLFVVAKVVTGDA